jgi:hypothetical protein
MITRAAAAAVLLAIGVIVPWSAAASGAGATTNALPACTVRLHSGSTNNAPLRLANDEVLCASGAFTNKSTITVASGGSAVIEAPDLVNDGSVTASPGTTLQLTSAPANLSKSTLTGGTWIAGGTLSLPGKIATLAARVTLTGAGEIENSVDGSNAVDSMSTIKSTGVFALNDSAYLGTGHVTSAGTVVLGTAGDPSDAVNWQDSGTFTMTGGSFTFLDPNSCINVGSRAFRITGGTMSGFGMLTGAVAVSGSAVFAPTLHGTQASFWLDGSYTQTGGTFEDTVNDPSGTPNAGSLWVSGAVAVGGDLEALSTGSRPESGASFQVIDGSSVSGSFASVENAGVAGFSQSIASPNASIVTLANSPPSAPRTTSAVAKGSGAATVSWRAPSSNGGEPVTSYAIVANPACACSGLSAGGAATSTVVSGLRTGTTYSFVVKARNSIGTGVPSVATNSVS